MDKKDYWTDGCRTAEVYRSSRGIGSRYSMLGRVSLYKIRGAHIGINGWATRAEAHASLAARGFAKAVTP